MAGFTVQGVPKCQGRKLQAIEFGRTFNIEESSRFIGISPTGCLIKPKTGNEALGKGRLKGQSLAAPFAPKNRKGHPQALALRFAGVKKYNLHEVNNPLSNLHESHEKIKSTWVWNIILFLGTSNFGEYVLCCFFNMWSGCQASQQKPMEVPLSRVTLLWQVPITATTGQFVKKHT